MLSKQVIIIAHRGCAARCPENTLAAFRAALAAGADMVEFDVGLSADLRPVILHDATLDRTTDGRGPLAARTLAELRELDAGAWFAPEFAGERIPFLEEALDLLAGKAQANIEVKPEVLEQVSPDRAAVLVLGPVRERGLLDSVVFSSFAPAVLDALRLAEPQARLGVLADRPQSPDAAAARVRELAAFSYNPDESHLTPELVAAIHAAKALVLPWARAGRNNEKIMRRVLALGADGFFADDPGLLARLLAGRAP